MANDRPPEHRRGTAPSPYATTCAPRSRPPRGNRRRVPTSRREYVDRVREQSARFALRTAAPDDIRAAVALLEEQTNVQALAPVDSRNRGVSDGEEGRAQGRVLHGQPPDRADPRARAGRRRRWATPRPSASSSSKPGCTSSRARLARPRGAPRIVTEVHQFLSTFAGRDAIGMHTLRLRKLLRDAGFESDIYAVDTHDDVRDEALDPSAFPAALRGERRRVDPLPLLDRQPAVRSGARARRAARARLPQHHRREVLLALGAARRDDACSKAAASSRSRRRRCGSRSPTPRSTSSELVELGCARTAVAPILIDFADYDTPPDADAARRAATRARRGRLRLARRSVASHPTSASTTCCSRSRCTAASTIPARGSRSSAGRARASTGGRCTRLAEDLGVADAVTFTDVVSHAELLACYRTTDVFVLPLRARGLQRAGARSDALRRAGARVRVVGRSRHRRRRRAAAHRQGPGRRGHRRRPPTLGCIAAPSVSSTAGRKRVEHFSIARTGPQLLDALTRLMKETGS